MNDKIRALRYKLSKTLKAEFEIEEYFDGTLCESYWRFKIKYLRYNITEYIDIYESTLNHYSTSDLYDMIITHIKADILSYFIK